MRSVGGWPLLDGASWQEVPWWTLVSKTVSRSIISVVTDTLEETDNAYQIILGPNLNPKYSPFGLALFEIFPDAVNQSKALAISLGADPTTVEKDISDVQQLSKELFTLYQSHPVTNPSMTSMFDLRSANTMMSRSTEAMQGVSRCILDGVGPINTLHRLAKPLFFI